MQRQDPALPHTWFNLGIAWKRASEYDKALAQLQHMAELVPDEPVTHYNLGVLYKLVGKPQESVGQFEIAESSWRIRASGSTSTAAKGTSSS